MLEELYELHTGQARERISADLERDTIFTAAQAVEYGLIDRITTSRKRNPVDPRHG